MISLIIARMWNADFGVWDKEVFHPEFANPNSAIEFQYYSLGNITVNVLPSLTLLSTLIVPW